MAVLALAGQLASFAHLALVRHVTCAEHGELIEVGSAATSAAATPRDVPPAVSAAASAGAAHDHEHCLISPMRRDRIASAASASQHAARVDSYDSIGIGRTRTVAPPIAAIVLAPKSSPPTA